jgi:hypothetical protein
LSALGNSLSNRVVKPGEVKVLFFLEAFAENNEIIFFFFTIENTSVILVDYQVCWIDTTLL